MDNQDYKNSIELKAKVKVNIYKTLLEEEKQKNKKTNAIGLSLFIIGIVSTTTLYQLKDSPQPGQLRQTKGLVKVIGDKNNKLSKSAMDIFNASVIENRKESTVKEEDFFVSDFKM